MERKGGSVLVIGSLNADLVTRVERLPAPGETVLGSSFTTHCGGKGANQAVAAARMGAAVRMVGCVGGDAFGRRLLEEISSAGIDVDGVRIDTQASTGTAQILVDAAGRNQIAVAPGANASLTAEETARASSWDGVSTLVLQLEVPSDVNEAAIRTATARGVAVVLNTAPAREVAPETLELVSWLVLNENEAEALSGRPVVNPADAVAAVAALGRRAAAPAGTVVTLGAGGAVLVAGDLVLHRSAHLVDVVDTVAAGDAFVGAFAAALAEGRAAEECLGRAVAAGSLACTRSGAISSLPTAAEVEALLARPGSSPAAE